MMPSRQRRLYSPPSLATPARCPPQGVRRLGTAQRRLLLAAVIGTLLSGCAQNPTAVNANGVAGNTSEAIAKAGYKIIGGPLIPDATVQLGPSVAYPVEKLVYWGIWAGAAYWILDPLAPNWDIEEARLQDIAAAGGGSITEYLRGEPTFRIGAHLEKKEFGRAWDALNAWLVADPGRTRGVREQARALYERRLAAVAGRPPYEDWVLLRVAVAALALNAFVLPRTAFGRALSREGEPRWNGLLSYPLAVAAGLATLEILQQPGVWDGIAAATSRLVGGLKELAQAAGVEVTVPHAGTMFTIFFAPGPVRDWQTAKQADTKLFSRFYLAMQQSGIYLAPSQFEACFVSAAHLDEHIDLTLQAAQAAFRSL